MPISAKLRVGKPIFPNSNSLIQRKEKLIRKAFATRHKPSARPNVITDSWNRANSRLVGERRTSQTQGLTSPHV